MPPLRVVLDTSVLISKLLYAPGSAWLVQAWQNRALIPVATEETLAELKTVLYRAKFGLSITAVDVRMAEYRPWCQIYPEDAAIPVPECRDPDDRKFLQLAIQCQADALVTADYDLLTLQPDFPIPIITLEQLQSRLTTAQN